MKKRLLAVAALTPMLYGGYHASISPITPSIKNRMIKGHSWHPGCPVPLNNLRYLRMTYRGFDGKDHTGEMVVNKSVAKDVTQIFSQLYKIGYPVHKMRLISDYNGNDFQSIEADNTSAFNCRRATGSKNWSRHSYGRAIDINPIENPYVYRSGKTVHKKSQPYLHRRHRYNSAADRAMLIRGDKAVKIFTSKVNQTKYY